jgi:pyridoxine 5-phosphate synthase
MKSILLGVNLDHVATLRQVRGTTYPSLIESANVAIAAAADSITLHLREDRRHIQDKDLMDLKSSLTVPMNLELAITDEMLEIAENFQPKYCCFVPERRE